MALERHGSPVAGYSGTMPADDVEIVREFYASVNRWLVSYWADPGLPVKETPELNEVFDRLTDDAEWDWLFSGETFRGRAELLRGLADWLETVEDWRIEINEVIQGTEGRVFATMRVHAHGKGSGAPAEQTVFAAVTVRDGRVARIEDHTERTEGLEAAGI
jgi:ketosteroid isomerase-like protein